MTTLMVSTMPGLSIVRAAESQVGSWSSQTKGIGTSYFEKGNASEWFNYCGPSGSEAPDSSGEAGDLSKVYILGDSITLRAMRSGSYVDKLKDAGAKEIKIVASGASNLSQAGSDGGVVETDGNVKSYPDKAGKEYLQEDKEYLKSATTVIVAHGTNGITKEDIADAINRISKDAGSKAKIYWVDVALIESNNRINAGGNYQGMTAKTNKLIYENTGLGYSVISWAKAVDTDPSYKPTEKAPNDSDGNFDASDPIHPSIPKGITKYVDTVVGRLKGGGTKVSNENDNSPAETDSSSKSSGSNLQSIADEAVSTGKSQGVNVAIKISGDQSVSSGESEQMPSASVIKLLVAVALAKKNIPLNNVSNDLTLMIRDSNNEAANRLIDTAGGFGDINNVANELSIGSDAHIGRKMLETPSGSDPNTISSKGSDTLLAEIKKSADGGGAISKEYATAIIDAMKAQTVATKWGASGIPKEGMAHKTGELGGAQHDVGYFIKGDKWLNVTTMTNQPGGDGSKGVAIVKDVAKKLYDAWSGEKEQTANQDTCCANTGGSQEVAGGGAGEPLPDAVPEPWRSLINNAAAKHPDSDRRIVAATLWAENRGWPEYKEGSSTTSGVGAVGFWQFMPGTWASLGEDGDGDGNKDPKNPKDAVHAAFKHSPGSAGKPIIFGATGDAEGDFESKKFYRNDKSKESLLTHMANYNGNDGSAIEGSTLPNFQRAQNGDYVRMGYWLMATNFKKGWIPEGDKMVDATAQGAGAKGGSASTLSSDNNKTGGDCAKKEEDSSSAFGKGIVDAAKEMSTWGEKFKACYTWGGGHGSKEDLEKKIDSHFHGPENGVDCSGFTRAVILKGTGKDTGPNSTMSMCSSDKFEHIPLDKAQPGDFSISCSTHVAVILEVKGPGDFVTADSQTSGCGPGHGASTSKYKGTESFVLRLKG